MKSKRFVVRKSLIGKNQVITFTTPDLVVIIVV